jgi:D-alanine transfer protein
MTLRHHPPSPAPSPVSLAPGAPIDWAALLKRADRDYRSHADNNPFGFDNQAWTTMHARWVLKKKNTMNDEEFRQRVAQTPEWSDLDLLLDGLKDMGAEPLLLSTPLNGGYYDYTGVTYEGRRAYYDKLRTVAAAHGVPVVDFAEHDDDKYFLIDPGHLSSKGWIYFAQAFDAFYHDRLTDSPAFGQGIPR